MKQKTITNKKKSAWLNFLYLGLLAILLQIPSYTNAQIAHSNNFDLNSLGYTGNYSRAQTTVACSGAGMNRNQYTATVGNMITPALAGNNAALVTVSYSYRVMQWPGNTVAQNPWGNFSVQYSTASAAGPWTTVVTITNEVQTGTCINKTHTFTPPASGQVWIRWTVNRTAGDWWMNFDNVVVSQAAGVACTGTPNAGTVAISSATGCPSTNFNLTSSGLTSGLGITYQWQSAPAVGGPFTNILGANATALTTNVVANTFYRLVTTCVNGGATNTSNVISYTVVGGLCGCGSYPAVFAGSNLDEDITNVTVGSMNNSSLCGAVAPGAGSIAARYSNFTGITGPTALQGSTVSFSLTQSCVNFYDNGFQIYIDYNQNGSFADAGERVYNQPAAATGNHTKTGTFDVPFSALTGITRMRVVNVETVFPTATNYSSIGYTWGETEDYCFEITAPAPCVGTPNPGNTLSTAASVCANTPFTLSFQTPQTGAGLTFQWQSGPSALGPWSNIIGQTGTSCVIANQTAATWYRCNVECSGTPGPSNPLQVLQNGVLSCYCVPTTTFGCTDGDVVARVILNTLDNNSGTGCPSGTLGYSDYTGNPLLTTTLNAASSYGLTVFAGEYAEGYAAWIDYNDDGIFDNVTERIGNSATQIAGSGLVGVLGSSGTFTISISCTPPSGVHRLRVRAMFATNGPAVTPCTNNAYGEVEDYLITIAAAPICPAPGALTATPTALTADLSWPLNCSVATNYDIQYGPTGFALGTGTILTNQAATITGVAPNQNGAYTLTGLAIGTYDVYIRANCGGGNFSSWTIIPANFVIGYCVPTITNIGDYISNFVTTGAITNLSNAGTSSAAYEDFTAQSVSQYAGQSVNFTADYVGGFTGLNIWIDWNNNLVFDASEKVYSAVATAPNFASSFAVPALQTPGNYTMRVRASWNQLDPPACGLTSWGQTEDYTFNVAVPPTCASPTNLNATPVTLTTANLSWSAAVGGTNAPVRYYYAVTTSATAPGFGLWIDNGLSTTVTGATTAPSVQNYLHVRTDCDPASLGGDYSTWVVYPFFSGYCISTSTPTTGWISNVNTTGGAPNVNQTSLTDPSGYQDFTAAAPAFQGYPGLTYGINVFGNNMFNTQLAVYVDWNQDVDFADFGELVVPTGPFYGGTGNIANTFDVPVSALPGVYRMRVKTGATGFGPCGAGAQGETEDYNLTILAVPLCGAVSFASTYTTNTDLPLVCTGQTVNFDVSPAAPYAVGITYQLQYSANIGGPYNPVAGTVIQNEPQFSLATPLSGYYRIVLRCNGTPITTTNVPATVSISNPAITSVTDAAVCGPQSVTLTATATPALATIAWYTSLTGGAPVATGSTFITPVLPSTTSYFVQAQNDLPTATVGSGNLTSTSDFWTPYTVYDENARMYYMIKKSELNAAGISANDLTSLSFNVTSTGNIGQSNFTIKIAHTSATSVAAGFTTPLNGAPVTVLNPTSVPPPPLGWNTYNFDTPFPWNGVDNIIIDICFENDPTSTCPVCYGTNSGVNVSNTSYAATYGRRRDNAPTCDLDAGTALGPYNVRPQMRIGGAVSACNSPRQQVVATILTVPQLTIPSNGLFAPTIANFNPIPVLASSSTPGATVSYGQSAGLYTDIATSGLYGAGDDCDGTTLYAAPLSTTTYTVSANSFDGCSVQGTYTITVDASGIPNNVCGGSLVPVTNTLTYSVKNTLGATPGIGFPCGGIANQIWLKAVVPASGEVHVFTDKNGGSLTDITASNLALFYTAGQGCNPLPNNVACNTNGAAGGFSYAHWYGMTPGDTCYIRVAGLTSGSVQNGRIKVAVTSHLIWSGAFDNNINLPQNWAGGDALSVTVPSATRSIWVPAGTIQPKLFAATAVRGVNLQAASPFFVSNGINLNGFTLNVKGNWNVGPVANASAILNCNGLVEFNASGTTAVNQIITGKTTFGNLNTNNTSTGGTVQANGTTGVACVLTPVAGTLNANGNLVLKSTTANSAALVAPLAGTITGNTSVERKIGSITGYHYLSSAVSAATVNNTVTGWRDDFTINAAIDNQPFVPGNIYTSLPSVWEYDETNPNPNPDFGWISATGTTDNITPLKGFACVVPANVTVDVLGPLNNNIIPGGYTITRATDGKNMVGNPYASPISWSAFRGLASNTAALSSSGYQQFLTTGGYAGAYGTFNGTVGSPASLTDKIASSQSFLVECLQPFATINALNTIRLTTAADVTASFFSGYNSVPDMIRMEVQGNGSQNEMVVYFDASSTDAYNNNFDSRVMFAPVAGVPTIYSVVENNNIAINVMGQLNLDKVVPLGVKIQTAGTYSLVATDMTSFAPSVIAYLEDTQAGTMTNLRTNPSYSVTLPVGEINNRFFLHFHPAVELNAINETCAGNDGKLVINYPTSNTVNVVIKDANGNVVNSQNNVSGLVTINNLVAGNYVAEMTFGVAPNTYSTSDFFTVAVGNAVYANLSASANTVDMGANTTVNFTATAQGATSFNWNFGDGTVVTNGPANMSHTFAQAGTYNVTFEASNGICNTVATTTVEVTNATGLTAIANSNLQVIGVGSKVTVRFGNNLEGSGNIEVINMLGEVVAHLDNVSMKGTREIEMSSIAAGQYMVKITNNNKLYTEKVYLSRQ